MYDHLTAWQTRGCTAGSWAAFRMGSSSVWLLSCRYSGSRVRAADSSQASVASRMLRFLLGSRSMALLTALTLALRPCNPTSHLLSIQFWLS